jgi:hypothetical protein
MCSTTHTAAAKSAGSAAASMRSARTPPALAPITTMSRRCMTETVVRITPGGQGMHPALALLHPDEPPTVARLQQPVQHRAGASVSCQPRVHTSPLRG